MEFIKIIEFEVLNPEGVIGIIKPGFKLKDLYQKKQDNSLNPKKSMLDNVEVIILFGLVFVIFMILLSMLLVFKNLRTKVLTKLVAIKKKMVFNGIIRSFTVACMGLLMSIGVQFKLFIDNSLYLDVNEFYTAVGLLSIMFFILIGSIVFINKKRHLFHTQSFRSKWEVMYLDIHLTRSW